MNDQNIGSSFDAFLQEDSILEDATEVAIERIADWLNADVSKDSGQDNWLIGSDVSIDPRSIHREYKESA